MSVAQLTQGSLGFGLRPSETVALALIVRTPLREPRRPWRSKLASERRGSQTCGDVAGCGVDGDGLGVAAHGLSCLVVPADAFAKLDRTSTLVVTAILEYRGQVAANAPVSLAAAQPAVR
jgi:hypothetical protein